MTADATTPKSAPASPAAAAAARPAKKERIVTKPVPPPAITTAYLLLRGTIAGILGCPIGGSPSATASLLQPTYLKDPYPSGKFSFSLGKKQGTLCALPVPETEEGQEKFWDSVEREVNRWVREGKRVRVCERERVKLVEGGRKAFLDESLWKLPKKMKEADKLLNIGVIEGLVVGAVEGPFKLVASTDLVGSIVLERQFCHVTASKHARKCEVVIKFRLENNSNGGEDCEEKVATVEEIDDEVLDKEYLKPLIIESKIRLEEGRLLENYFLEEEQARQRLEQEEMEKATRNMSIQEDAKGSLQEDEMVVNAFEVKGKIDYNKLVDNFGSKLIDAELLERIERLTVGRGTVPYLHRFLRRDIFFSHRDMVKICECLEQNKPFYLYTGRGPSSGAMHLGHLVPFMFTQWLQQAFQCPLVIQMTDDEKFLFKGVYDDETGDNLDYFAHLTMENAKDIIACGFIPEKTFLFSDLQYVGTMYPTIVRIWKAVTVNTVNGIFGFDGSANMGKIAFPAIQAAPSFPSAFPRVLGSGKESANMACLIPCAIDQDPYFRMTRDIAHKLVPKDHPLGGKPALIHSKFFPPLQGAEGKMSSSDENSAIFLTDTADMIEKKIKEYAFSGGQETKKLQQELGANLDVDVAYQWLRFFLEDDEELAKIGKDYSTGSGEFWSTAKVKARLVEVLKEVVDCHQAKRQTITDEVVLDWMKERLIV